MYPYSKRILLTAYADTQAAIQSINEIDLDYYLVKPWDPPEQHLFPIVDDLLFDWEATSEIEYAGIRVGGFLWSSDCHDVKDFLAKNLIPYQWLDIELDEENESLVKTVVEDLNDSPIVFFPDGDTLVKPSISELAEKVGLKTQAKEPFYDLVVIGAGPAGLAAGVYGASEGLSTIVIEKEAPGGQAGTSSRIENYLGFPSGISGADLTRRAVAQAERLGAELMITREVVEISLNDQYKIIKLDDGTELRSRAVLVATGVQVNQFNVPGIDELSGSGVYYGASLTEAASYRDKEVYVLGGGNSAGQGAMFFSRYASRVHIVIRRTNLEETMSKYLIDRIEAAENVDLLGNTEITELIGKDKLEELTIKNNVSGDSVNVPASALFIFIGARPITQLVHEHVECDEAGFIRTDNLVKKWTQKRPPFPFETKTPGIFAVGDVRSGSSKRVAAAVGEGAVSVQMIHRYISTV